MDTSFSSGSQSSLAHSLFQRIRQQSQALQQWLNDVAQMGSPVAPLESPPSDNESSQASSDSFPEVFSLERQRLRQKPLRCSSKQSVAKDRQGIDTYLPGAATPNCTVDTTECSRLSAIFGVADKYIGGAKQ